MYSIFPVFSPYFALFPCICYLFLQLNLTRFLFTSLFCYVFFSTLVPLLFMFSMPLDALRPSRSGHGRRVERKNCEFVFSTCRFLFPSSLRPFLKLTTFCCPCGFLRLFSSFRFSLACASSRTVNIKRSQAPAAK